MKGVEQIEHSLHNLASPKRGHTFWGLIGVWILALFLLWCQFSALIQAPNNVMIANSSDGFKNYMTTIWHVKYDSSYVHYEGMDYPYGEHVLFTDNQPILSAAMQWWSRKMFDVSDRVVGIIHLFLILSVVFGVGVLYLLLRKLHLPVWYASMAALGIAFLSPQLSRIDGHFGLAHIWVFPLVLLLLCRYEERKSRRYQSLMMGLLIWFAAQLHFYYLGVAAVFLGFYTLFQILIDGSWRSIWTRFSHILVMVLLPFAALNVWLHWSDYSADRPAAPYGFTEYIGRWEGVFLPYNYFPLYQWISQHIVKIRGLDFEAQSYAGFLVFGFTLWLLFKRRFKLFEPEWEQAAYHRVHKNYLRGICFAGFATLLFAFGFPFAFKEMEWMLDYMGPLRQFRGLGRFTWAFYYSANVLIFYILWNKSQRIKLPEKFPAWFPDFSALGRTRLAYTLKWSLILLPLAIISCEAYLFQKNNTLTLVPSLAPAIAAKNPNYTWLQKVDFARFQALMPLPYYHLGSENIWLEPYFPLFQKVQNTAIHTGVPDMGVNLSRTAISRTVKSLQFSLPACEPPVMLSELPDNRPIALLIEPTLEKEVTEKYPHLLEKATPVYRGKNLIVLSLIPDSVRTWSRQQALERAAYVNRYARIDAGNGWLSDKPDFWYKGMSFDSLTDAAYRFQGTGAGTALLEDKTYLFRQKMPKGTYFFSIWLKIDTDMALTQEAYFTETRASGMANSTQKVALRTGLKTIVQGWALFELPFEVTEVNAEMAIYLQKKGGNGPFWYDECLIRSQKTQLYRQTDQFVVHNNVWYKKPDYRPF